MEFSGAARRGKGNGKGRGGEEGGEEVEYPPSGRMTVSKYSTVQDRRMGKMTSHKMSMSRSLSASKSSPVAISAQPESKYCT